MVNTGHIGDIHGAHLTGAAGGLKVEDREEERIKDALQFQAGAPE